MKKLFPIIAALLLSGCSFQPDKHSPIVIVGIKKSKNPNNGLYLYRAVDTKRGGGFSFWSDSTYWIGTPLTILPSPK